jgi:type IV pilus assembly protein PilE
MSTSRCSRRPASGFTLIELMITVAVVAILGAIALPSYKNYMIRGKLPAAFTQLSGYSMALQQWYQDNRTYVGYKENPSGLDCTTGASYTPSNSNFSYTCTGVSSTAFTLTATGVTGTTVAGFTYTLNESGTQATTAVPSGWSNKNCGWVRDSAGDCN